MRSISPIYLNRTRPKTLTLTLNHLFFSTTTVAPHQPHSQPPPPPPPPATASQWTKTIHRLCTIDRNVDAALHLLDQLRLHHNYTPNTLNISSIIHALCASCRFTEAHHRLHLFIASNSLPDERTSNVLIARLLYANLPDYTFNLIREIVFNKPEFVPSLVNYNRLMHQFCGGMRVRIAHGLFFDMVGRGHVANVVSYSTLIDGYCKVGDLISARKVFDEMSENGVLANSLSYSVLISGVLRTRDVEEAKRLMIQLWSHMSSEEDSSVKIWAFGNLIDSLCREGFISEVFRIAEDMPQEIAMDEKSSYEKMIDSLCKYGRSHGASRIVYIMKKRGYTPSDMLYNNIIYRLCKQSVGYMRAYQLLFEGVEWGFKLSEIVYMILTQELCRDNELAKAKKVLQVMLNNKSADGTRVYNMYLRALCFMNNPTELLNVLLEMVRTGFHPDIFTLNTVVTGLCKNGRVDDGLKVLEDMISGKFCDPDIITFTTVIHGLLIEGRTNAALEMLFSKTPERSFHPTIATYNCVLNGLMKLRLANEAMDIFNTMLTHNIAPDSSTHAIIIHGLCNLDQVEQAKRVWDDVVWPSGAHDHFVYSEVLKGLCRAGEFHEACDFLYELADCGVVPNIVNYNIVIDGACKSGLRRDAYRILSEMRKNGIVPDACTWRILDKLHRKSKVKDSR